MGNCVRYFIVIVTLASFLVIPGTSFSAGDLKISKAEASHVVAEVHGKKITVHDIREFATNSPAFYAYLELPGGPNKILNDMILRELLYLEGHDMKIPENPEKPKEVYVRKVLNRLFPKEPKFTEDELRRFYDEHPELFSTPKFIRVSVVRVYVKRDGEAKALEKIQQAQELLKAGQAFEDVAARFSEDPLSRDRKGDLGFLPDNEIKPPSLRKLLESMKKGQLSDVQRIDGYFAIFKVTDIRGPVVEPFNKKFVEEKAKDYLKEKAINDIRSRLAKKWGVKYIDPAFAPDTE